MPVPIAQSLFQQIFGSSGTAASLTRPTETTDQEGEDVVRKGPEVSFQDLLTRQFLGPSILPSMRNTSSGSVFQPDPPIPAKPDILATYPEKIETQKISTPIPTDKPQGIIGLPIPETQDKLKGFETPKLPNFNILNKKLNELPEDKVDKFFEKQDSLYDDDYEINFKDWKKIKEGVIPENKKFTFDDIIEQYGQYQPIHKYWESAWEGGVGNLGSREAGEIMRSGGMLQDEKGFTSPTYYEDYKTKLQELARKEFGRDFIGYRLMSKAEMDDLLNEGDAAFGVKSYSLKKKSAMAFKHFTNKAFIDMKTGEPRKDLILVEAPLDVEGLVMRGKSSEDEIVFDNQFVNPEQMNFYDLNGKLIKGAQSGLLKEDKKEKELKEYVAIDKPSLKTQDYLDEKVIDELLKLRGGKQKFQESMKESMAPMPASTKNKMEIILQQKLFDKYKLNEYPEGESPDTVSEERKKQLLNTYNKNLEAISYITSAAYDTISGPNKNTVFVVDNEGLPIAGAKIGRGDLLGNAAKEAIAIKEIGSINSNATNDLLKEVNARALADGKKYIVAEDITSQEAIDAFKAKGFESASLKKYKQFEGKLIYRPGGNKKVKQKNYVKEVEGYKENTSNPIGSLIDKPLSNE